MITEIFISTVELITPTETETNEVNAEVETQLLIVGDKTR